MNKHERVRPSAKAAPLKSIEPSTLVDLLGEAVRQTFKKHHKESGAYYTSLFLVGRAVTDVFTIVLWALVIRQRYEANGVVYQKTPKNITDSFADANYATAIERKLEYRGEVTQILSRLPISKALQARLAEAIFTGNFIKDQPGA